MRLISISVLFLTLISFGQVEPCSTFTCDSLAVRAILDSNGLDNVPVEIMEECSLAPNLCVTIQNGRIDTLQINGLEMKLLPPEVGKLTALKKLWLGVNQITGLPTVLWQLTALEWLDLGNNQLTELPPEIGQLTALYRLYLNHNQLTSLPPEIGSLTALTELALSVNQLTNLPSEIGQLTSLEYLYLGFNQLTGLPPEIEQLKAMVELHLQQNQLTSLPPEIGQLTALKVIHLENNQLTGLPKEMGQLDSLGALYISNNQLTSLPLEIGHLTSLWYLDLGTNHLTSLPPAIGQLQLTALELLDLRNNKLTSLPPEIINISPQSLSVMDNYLCSLPDSIEAWLDELSDDPLWRETQDCGSCLDTDFLEYGTDEPCHNLKVYERSLYGKPDIQYNIFNNSITITFPNSTAPKLLSIYTLKGELVKESETNRNSVTWNIQGQSGMYYLRVVVEGKRIVRKVVL